VTKFSLAVLYVPKSLENVLISWPPLPLYQFSAWVAQSDAVATAAAGAGAGGFDGRLVAAVAITPMAIMEPNAASTLCRASHDVPRCRSSERGSGDG
jgi:hypothetical protein